MRDDAGPDAQRAEQDERAEWTTLEVRRGITLSDAMIRVLKRLRARAEANWTPRNRAWTLDGRNVTTTIEALRRRGLVAFSSTDRTKPRTARRADTKQ